jgi:hypothetical protein
MSRLDDPVFVTYININGKSRQRAQEIIQETVDKISPILGELNIFIPIEQGDNRVELLWPGNNFSDKSMEDNLIAVLDNILTLIQGNWQDEKYIKDGINQIKSSLRTLKIDQLDGIS